MCGFTTTRVICRWCINVCVARKQWALGDALQVCKSECNRINQRKRSGLHQPTISWTFEVCFNNILIHISMNTDIDIISNRKLIRYFSTENHREISTHGISLNWKRHIVCVHLSSSSSSSSALHTQQRTHYISTIYSILIYRNWWNQFDTRCIEAKVMNFEMSFVCSFQSMYVCVWVSLCTG